MTEQVEKKKLSKKEYIDRFKAIFQEIDLLNADVKQLKDDAKEDSYDAALLSKIGKALAEEKIGDILEKAEVFAATVDQYELDATSED